MGAVQGAAAATWYVATNGNDGAAGTTWATAKQTIQVAIDAAHAADTVWVSNGVYKTGGRVPPQQIACRARVVIDKRLLVQSVNGASNTVIMGLGPIGDTAVRCLWMTNSSTLVGFTLTNGFTTALNGYEDDKGGGVYCGGGAAIVSNCVIAGCSSFDQGGGMYEGTAKNCAFIGNTSAQNGGGSSQADLSDCTLRDNWGDSGGGVFGGTHVNCHFLGNITGKWGNGGGAYLATLHDCVLSGNIATDGGGGGTSYCDLYNCLFSGNSASGGGASDSDDAFNCIFQNNFASDSGGAAYGGNLYYCTFKGNLATWGGGVYDAQVYSCVFVANAASGGGGGFYGYGGIYGDLFNCTLYANINGGAQHGHAARNTISFQNTVCDFAEMGAVNFCYTNDPLFVAASAGNFQLQPTSPCLNAGLNAFAYTNTAPYDYYGNTRISGGTVDIGACEYQTSAQILASAGPNGTISPSGWVQVAQGGSQSFTMIPNPYYQVQSVLKNGAGAGAVTNLVWSNVVGVCSISAAFAPMTTANGTPLWWLASYGWTQNVAVADSADPDGDGLPTWREYQVGTDPNNPNTDGDQFNDGVEVSAGMNPTQNDSVFYAAILGHSGLFSLYTTNSVGDLSMGCAMLNVISNKVSVSLTLQGRDSLTSGSWTNVGSSVFWEAPVSADKCFYRFRGTPTP